MSALTAKGRATQERIVAAAATLMYEQGVAVTSIDEVKAQAGVSSSQLYHYFADKQALVQAVIAHQAEQVLTFQEAELAGVDGVGALRVWRDRVVAANRRFGPEGGCPVGSLAAELTDRDPAHRAALIAAFDRWETAIGDGLVRMRDRGELPAGADAAALATGLLAALQGGLLLAQVRRSSDPLATALDQAIDHISAAGAAGP
jgi:TetR/AcrR family transcriptional regulator, transcriptional repressor for nem operon